MSYILNTIKEYKNKHKDKIINLELFGGDPSLPQNYDDIIKIFDFCKEVLDLVSGEGTSDLEILILNRNSNSSN